VSVLESAGLAPPSINLRLSAIRKLAAEAAENDLLDRSVAQGVVSLKGVHQSGNRAGNLAHLPSQRSSQAQQQPFPRRHYVSAHRRGGPIFDLAICDVGL
jgi:hypothetical protein